MARIQTDTRISVPKRLGLSKCGKERTKPFKEQDGGNDLSWFAAHPHTFQRLRRALPNEFNVPANLVLVRKIEHGIVSRTPIVEVSNDNH